MFAASNPDDVERNQGNLCTPDYTTFHPGYLLANTLCKMPDVEEEK